MSSGKTSDVSGEVDATIEIGGEVGYKVQGYERQVRAMVAGEGSAVGVQ